MKTEFKRRVLMLFILAITVVCFDSVFAIACGYCVSAWVDTFIIAKAVDSLIGCSWWKQIKKCRTSLVLGICMYGGVSCMRTLAIAPLALMALQIVMGIVIYTGFALAIKNDAMLLLLSTVRGKPSNR